MGKGKMQSSDKFFEKHYGDQLEKVMTDDMEEVIKEEQKTARKVNPAYESEGLPGWKTQHGGRIGWTEGGNQ